MPRIRPADVEDARGICAVYAPYVSEGLASFEDVPPEPGEMTARMLAPPRLPWFVATRADRVVGYAYAAHHRSRPGYRWSVDCSVYLADEERGRGTGGALYRRLLPVLPGLGYVSAYAGVALPNPGSVGLHEAFGFTAIGVYRQAGFKYGRWLDVGWWQLPLARPPARPQEPRAWSPAD